MPETTVLVEAYQEIILSTVPEHHHLWHRHGLTDRVQTPKEVGPAAIAGFGNY